VKKQQTEKTLEDRLNNRIVVQYERALFFLERGLKHDATWTEKSLALLWAI
jgi:hypothetical protein